MYRPNNYSTWQYRPIRKMFANLDLDSSLLKTPAFSFCWN